jgi:hypothetical protein
VSRGTEIALADGAVCPASQSDEAGSERVRWRDDRSGKSQSPPVTNIEEHLDNSLKPGTALISYGGFEKAAKILFAAHSRGTQTARLL